MGRRPSRMSSCGRTWPSISRSISTAMARRPAAAPGRPARNAFSNPVLSFGNMDTYLQPPAACAYISGNIVNTLFLLNNRRQFEARQHPTQGTLVEGEKTPVKLGNIPDDGQA